MRIASADRADMKELSDVHGGAGTILFNSLWNRADFESPFAFVHCAILLPGGGIGYHRHDDSEEIFIAIDNASQFTHNGRTAVVEGGAAVPLRSGEIHAIYNHTDRETRWFNVHCVVPGGEPKSTDLGDDRVGAELESTDRLPVGRLEPRCAEIQPSARRQGRSRRSAHLGTGGFPQQFLLFGPLSVAAGHFARLPPPRRRRGSLYHHRR